MSPIASIQLMRAICHGNGKIVNGLEPDLHSSAIYETEEAGDSDRWLYEPESRDLRPLKAGDGVGFEANAFSPDGERLLGSRGADLLVYDIASDRATPLTQDGEPDTIQNGSASWSPDGQWIASVQSDSSAVPKRAVLVPGDPTYRTFQGTRFERTGGQGFSLFHRAVADLGYLVVSIDNRGTPGPKGAAWRRAVFGSLGPLSTDEQAAGYRTSSAINCAEGLRGDLLIISGSGETNKHIEIPEGLVDRLIEPDIS